MASREYIITTGSQQIYPEALAAACCERRKITLYLLLGEREERDDGSLSLFLAITVVS
jgi:hypothetical protein